MIKVLKTVNVDYLNNRFAQDIIYKNISEGWGIDAMVEDSNRNTWVTFYRYETKENFAKVLSEQVHEPT